MLDQGEGRAAMVDLGSKSGIITPVTSFYVPTKNEMSPEERAELDERVELRKHAEPGQGARLRNTTARPAAADWELAIVEHDSKEGGTGARAKGDEGSMGASAPSTAENKRYAVKGPADNPARGATSRAASLREAQEFGLIGVLDMGALGAPPPAAPQEAPKLAAVGAANAATDESAQKAPAAAVPSSAPGGSDKTPGGDPNAPTAPWGREDSLGEDTLAARGNMWGDSIGVTPGSGGLGLSGVGEGGGGKGEGIGLGTLGTLGHGSGTGTGQGFGSGHGRLGGSHLSSTPQVRMGATQVTGSLPGGGTSQAPTPVRVAVRIEIGDLPRFALRCSGASAAPLEERVGLWRERLLATGGDPSKAAAAYRTALSGCEAPSWRERSRLLSLMLDSMPSVAAKVRLWRSMTGELGASDALYRGLLARVRTADQMRELHAALGLRSADPQLLKKLLDSAKTPAERVTKLRALAVVWPNDFVVALALLDALEDARDDGGARDLGRKLRSRPDADARVRTAVGELYLRLGARAEGAQKDADIAEAKRAFGEIVEFAPDDPVARRRLGDLLRSHGWYAEAKRQYETLTRLAPDDASVPLLLAAAAEGRGMLEEALGYTDKGGASGAPDAASGAAVTARALGATYLAWGRLQSRSAGKAKELEALTARATRVLFGVHQGAAGAGARVTLSWAHPELHPTLWSNALGSPMPAPEGDVTLGILQVTVPERDASFVEVRLEPDEVEHAARLGAGAELTVVFDELGAGEKIVRVPVSFARGGPATLRFSMAGREVRHD